MGVLFVLLLEIIRVNALHFIDLLDAYTDAIFNHVVTKLLSVNENHLDIRFRFESASL